MARLACLVAGVAMLFAGPAVACRVSSSQFTAAFREEPRSAPDDLVLFGRIVRTTDYVPEDSSSDPEISDPSRPYLFGILERSGQPPVRVYRSAFRSSCDITPDEIFAEDVWIVARPLPEDGAGARVSLLVLRRSGAWGAE
ncbi:MAG: hypothetical protein REJ23_08745 [Brevundimonas sp.]|nr:hypothetical protein [Brevundimonas sp.]